MTEPEKLTEILTWIRSCGVRVRIRQDPKRKAKVNGCYEHNTIVVYTQDRQREASEIATALLHEYGHHVATQCVGLWNHTEQDAWLLAEQITRQICCPRVSTKPKNLLGILCQTRTVSTLGLHGQDHLQIQKSNIF